MNRLFRQTQDARNAVLDVGPDFVKLFKLKTPVRLPDTRRCLLAAAPAAQSRAGGTSANATDSLRGERCHYSAAERERMIFGRSTTKSSTTVLMASKSGARADEASAAAWASVYVWARMWLLALESV